MGNRTMGDKAGKKGRNILWRIQTSLFIIINTMRVVKVLGQGMTV